MKNYSAAVFILVALAVSVATAAVPGDTGHPGPIVTGPDLNRTMVDITNHSIPSRYEMTPTRIDVRIEVTDTALPGPKGEMEAGPRTIGFSADPLLLAFLVVAVVAIAAGTWFRVKRNPEEPGEEDE